jgi:hypothetical protein
MATAVEIALVSAGGAVVILLLLVVTVFLGLLSRFGSAEKKLRRAAADLRRAQADSGKGRGRKERKGKERKGNECMHAWKGWDLRATFSVVAVSSVYCVCIVSLREIERDRETVWSSSVLSLSLSLSVSVCLVFF